MADFRWAGLDSKPGNDTRSMDSGEFHWTTAQTALASSALITLSLARPEASASSPHFRLTAGLLTAMVAATASCLESGLDS